MFIMKSFKITIDITKSGKNKNIYDIVRYVCSNQLRSNFY